MRIPFHAYLCALLSALALIALPVLASSAVSASSALTASPMTVSLTDARRAPYALRYVRPGRETTFSARALTDVSAYRWNGRALGPQSWDSAERMAYWRGRNGRVGYKGGTFYNGTARPVLVAIWRDA